MVSLGFNKVDDRSLSILFKNGIRFMRLYDKKFNLQSDECFFDNLNDFIMNIKIDSVLW